MTILLLRHGETALNVARVLQPADTPLAPRGEAQARALAQRLALEPPAVLVSSPLPRAAGTAAAIAAATGLAIEWHDALQERNFGAWRGRPIDALDFDPFATDDVPPGGESRADFAARVARAFDWLVRRRAASPGPIAVVSHGLVIHAMLARHARIEAPHRLPARMSNTSVSVLDAAPPHRVRVVDCTRHLDAPIADAAQSLSGG